MEKNEDLDQKQHRHRHRHHHQNNDKSNISQNRSLTKSKVSFSDELDIPMPNNSILSNSQIPDDSFEQHTQKTLLKLRSIIEEKSKLIDIQKERIQYFNKKLNEDQIILSKLDQNYQEQKKSLYELQQNNQTLTQNYNELKTNHEEKENEIQTLTEKIKQINHESEKLNAEISLFEKEIIQFQEEESLNNSRIDLALQSKNIMIEDNEEMKNKINEYENYKKNYEEIELRIPEIQERVIRLQKEVISHNSRIIENKAQLEQLTEENYILKKKCQTENKVLKMNQVKYSKLKKEIDVKLQLKAKLDVLSEKLSKNKQYINEAEVHVQKQDEYLSSIKKFNKQKLKENLSVKNHLLSLQDELKNVKSHLIQITMENANNKQMINDKIEEYVNFELGKTHMKIKYLKDKETKMKNGVKEMKNIVQKLECDINSILLMKEKICNENENNKPENVPSFEFSELNFSNLQSSIKNVEDNNDVISFLIEDNQNQKENSKKALNDDVPNLPKQTVEEKAKKYGLF